ncbi:MAG: hypothetical protein SFV17_03000 [Candidatus Obscuribacter sp.]|nr:hypothetical protein [Candidatus Melainabacteria bacterium]MDX1985632.1 hypothetical protein [Candidatus Obscuribacter sp.]
MSTSKTRAMSARQTFAFVLLFGFISLSSLAILTIVLTAPEKDSQSYRLERVISAEGRLGREGLQKIKALPVSSGKEQVFQTLGQPMGQLRNLETPQVGILEQYAYPLAFAPDVQVVLLFKADSGQLVGYRFAFNGTIPRKS